MLFLSVSPKLLPVVPAAGLAAPTPPGPESRPMPGLLPAGLIMAYPSRNNSQARIDHRLCHFEHRYIRFVGAGCFDRVDIFHRQIHVRIIDISLGIGIWMSRLIPPDGRRGIAADLLDVDARH